MTYQETRLYERLGYLSAEARTGSIEEEYTDRERKNLIAMAERLNPSIKHSTKKLNCIPEAKELRRRNNGVGNVYWVSKIQDRPVGHAYYVKDESNANEKALNQADNGFEGFPALTVKEVLENGSRITCIEEEIACLLTLDR